MSLERQEQWNAVVDKRFSVGLDSLTDSERVWFTVRSLIDAVEGGGLISYYYNSGADDLPDCLESLRLLDSPRTVEIVEEVNALFPTSTDLTDFESRNEAIDAWPDSDSTINNLLEKVDDRLFKEFEQLEQSLESFLLSHGFAA